MPRRKARVDANQSEVVAAFRAAGATVQHLHMVGGGCPDILIGYRGHNYLFEIKDGSKPPSRRKLTEAEQEFVDMWNGQVDIVESPEDALEKLFIKGDTE